MGSQTEIKINYSHSPNDIKHWSTSQLRDGFLVKKIFEKDNVNLTYTYNDRAIFGGVFPVTKPLEIVLDKELGVDYFLQRRELGVLNIGGDGFIQIDGEKHTLKSKDCYYIGKETKEVIFLPNDKNNPPKYYIASTPAHHKYPNVKIPISKIIPVEAGDTSTANERKIHQYIHPNNCESCQLQMGYTVLAKGSNWNTMPAHTHKRRMEVYLYLDVDENQRVFHFMGKPDETKHIAVGNEQAVISPSWSIHSGVGTDNYSFIWAMCGENLTYTDMDEVKTNEIK
jgi:4-deoxy-L-threo-5-hexosulose-uronate ketol-isomerase